MTPGDAWVDPIIKRGEELLRLAQADGIITPAEQAEHDSYVEYARIRQKHLADFPLANTSQEESAEDLLEEQARDRDELLAKAWKLAEPAMEAAFATLLSGGFKR